MSGENDPTPSSWSLTKRDWMIIAAGALGIFAIDVAFVSALLWWFA